MRHIMKAVFDDRDKAQLALAELLACGYARTDMVLATIPGAGPAGAAGALLPAWRQRPGASSARLLARLVGRPGSRPAAASTPSGGPESHVLTLSTDSAQEEERAASLIACFMTGATAGQPTPTGGHWYGMLAADAGMHEVRAGQPCVNDAARTAYRFGRDMHENERYRNRAWREARADLKVLWEARGTEQAAWDRSEAAVRLGWDSTSPEIDDDSFYRSHWRMRHAGNARDTPDPDAATAAATWSAATPRHRGEPTAWENFVDAIRHGWSRTRIGDSMDEADYRLHHARTYPGTNYDDLAPVYRYGHHMRGRAMFAERGWDEVESELRAEWERGHREGKPSTWDEMKAALRHGWDRTQT